jgi:hypothetical protein
VVGDREAHPRGYLPLPFLDALVAELRDANNERVASYNGAASIALATNPSSATLGGTTTVTAVNGVATFSGLSIQKAAQGYTLSVSAQNITSATTNAFDIAPAPASVLAMIVLLAVAAVGASWALLRTPPRGDAGPARDVAPG